jgi:hypothetical protein
MLTIKELLAVIDMRSALGLHPVDRRRDEEDARYRLDKRTGKPFDGSTVNTELAIEYIERWRNILSLQIHDEAESSVMESQLQSVIDHIRNLDAREKQAISGATKHRQTSLEQTKLHHLARRRAAWWEMHAKSTYGTFIQLSKRHWSISSAFYRIIGAHRTLSNRVRAFLVGQATTAHFTNDLEALDKVLAELNEQHPPGPTDGILGRVWGDALTEEHTPAQARVWYTDTDSAKAEFEAKEGEKMDRDTEIVFGAFIPPKVPR